MSALTISNTKLVKATTWSWLKEAIKLEICHEKEEMSLSMMERFKFKFRSKFHNFWTYK
jgi:hypothetical protein